MFGLQVGTDVGALIGCSLESIELTEHQVQLRLDSLNGITLSIESDFSITPSEGEASRYARPTGSDVQQSGVRAQVSVSLPT